MEYSILGSPTNRDKLNKWFETNRTWFRVFRSNVAVVVAASIVWLVVLVLLFLFLAYRPEWTVLPGLHIYRKSPEVGQPVVLENQSGSRQFTEYLARTTGLIPAACTVSERSIQIPLVIQISDDTDSDENTAPERPDPEKAADAGVDEAGPPEATLPPGLLGLLVGENARQELGACRWRNEPSSILAVVSFVGVVQKLTLFLLVLGLVLVRKGNVQIRLDAVCFPGRSKVRLWKQDQNKNVEMMVHPVLTPPNGEKEIAPLYPTKTLILDGTPASEAGIVAYRTHVYSTRLAMGESQLRQPFDLILNVLDSGVKHRRVGPMTDRIASATFDFRERVSNRFWFVDYILWLLPTIGFLGTIYGISVSLVRAKGLFDEENDFSQVIRQVVDGLGVAFDTTSMALICSAILYLFLRRTEARIAPLVDRAEETLTELLVASFEDTPSPIPPSNGEGQNDADRQGEAGADEITEDDEPDQPHEEARDRRRSGV